MHIYLYTLNPHSHILKEDPSITSHCLAVLGNDPMVGPQ